MMVAMESTGICWAPVFEILEICGLEVKLVKTRHVKNVPGKESDVLDCQWLQKLHINGLLHGVFRPIEQVCTLRVYERQRALLVRALLPTSSGYNRRLPRWTCIP
jgi:transposase